MQQITVLGSEILPGDLLQVRNWAPVEEIGSQRDGTTSLYIVDGGIRIVGDNRKYVVRREIADGPTILVIGDASSPSALEDLTAFAFDVADRLQVAARVAVGREYHVTDFEGAVIHSSWLDSIDSAVLGYEAQQADMFSLDEGDLYAYAPTKRCGHCFEDDEDAAPVLVGDTWTPSVCPSCVAAHRRQVRRGTLPVAA